MRWLLSCLGCLAVGVLLIASLRADDVSPPEKYRAMVAELEKWIDKEVKTKQLPALSLAIVDDQTVVWSRGFGYADPKNKAAATGDTLYRVGSVSKPFTAILLMMLVELGLIDLDVPVQTYLPEFEPVNKTGKKITLRQMLSHRSGLVRESPVGNYFDDSGPSLADTVKSLNKTELVYAPEQITSYSNAALATVGYVIERTQKKPFAEVVQQKLLTPLGMNDSSFDPSAEQRKRIAQAIMWTYQGRTFLAPKWDLGMAPAGSLYSSVNDQARFMRFLFSRGEGPKGRLLKADTLDSMFKLQFAKKDDKTGFGLGFFISELEGRRRISHGGAVYGFATEFAVLPDEKVGVIVCASKDVANAVTRRIGDTCLKYLLAIKEGKKPPVLEETTPVPAELAKKLAGVYQNNEKTHELYERDGRLWIFPHRGGMKIELRMLGEELVGDDALFFGNRIKVAGADLLIAKTKFHRVEPKPHPLPAKWAGLIGEYGPDHNILYILEKDGVLHALIEWTFLYPLKELSENVFQFPDYGLYHGDKIIFFRDEKKIATKADAASVLFTRRKLLAPNETFKIRPLRPVEELRKAALADTPPQEKNPLGRKSELVEVTSLDPSIKLDIRYASDNNFLGTPVYTSAKAFLQKPAAEALVRVHKALEKHDLGVLIHDGYRPWYITKIFWDATPEPSRIFVADPSKGSRHNRGCAVDLTLFQRSTGKVIDMPGNYDEFSDRSSPDYLGGTSEQRRHRDLLRRHMEAEGFNVYEAEWWHFDYRDWRLYPILNQRFEDLAK
jgi:CubicO group peptidase (beta-lactamase class C family)/D-alanyl-D-alanine dipeptidase